MEPSRGLSVCVASALLGSVGTVALLLALVPSLRESAVASLTVRRLRRPADDEVDNDEDWQNRTNDPRDSSSANGAVCQNGSGRLIDSVDLPLRILSKAEGVLQYRSTLLVVVERCVNDFNYSAILRTAEALGIQDVWLVDPPPAARQPASPTDGVLRVDGDVAHATTTTNEEQEGGDNNNDGRYDSTTGNVAALLLPQNGSVKQPVIPRGMTEEERNQRTAHHLFAQNATHWLSIREFATSAECLRELRNNNYQVWATDLSQKAVPLDLDGMPPAALPSNGKVAVVFGTEAVGVSQEVLENCDLRVYLPLRGFADSLNLSVAAALVIQQVLQLYPDLIGNYPHKAELRQQWYVNLASQRMSTPRQKKEHRKLRNQVVDCQSYRRQQKQGLVLSKEQLAKLERMAEREAQLREMEGELAQMARASVERHVHDPPPPLTDLRRADEHRVTYVGKNTKQRHQDHWVGMAATANSRTQHLASANQFRNHHQLATIENSDEPKAHAAL